MSWKKLPEWLIGGLIGFGIWIFNQIISNILAGPGIVDNSLIANIAQIVFYFVLGAIMGFSITKIKSDKMKLWLRVGLLGIGVWIILFFVDTVRAAFVDSQFINNLLFFSGSWIYVNFIMPNLVIYEDWIIIISSVIFYFILGALIGFIVDNFKSKPKNSKKKAKERKKR